MIGFEQGLENASELFHAVCVSHINGGDVGELHIIKELISNLVVALLKNDPSDVVRRVNCLLVTLIPGSDFQGL